MNGQGIQLHLEDCIRERRALFLEEVRKQAIARTASACAAILTETNSGYDPAEDAL